MERLLAASLERKCSVYSAMKNPLVTTTFVSRTRESIEAFVEFIERTRGELARTDFNPSLELGSTPAAASIGVWADRFLDEIGYFNELRRGEKNPEMAENRIRNLKELMATLDDKESPATPPFERLETFLEEITLDNEREDEKDAPGDAVTLITMHSCKGLEFPHVYVVGLEDGLLPHSRSKVEGTMDEERRLFYVAITRAMLSLNISHCAGRKKYGQLLPCHPSPFLKELPAELVEHADEKAKQPVTTESGKNMFAAMREMLD
jgi:superfamily I DNA/RNA helicase